MLQVPQRDVHGGVESGGAVGVGPADRRLDRGLVVRERLQHGRAAVELHHLGLVLGPQPAGEPQRGLLGAAPLLLHRGRAVDHEHDRQRQVLVGEQRQLLRDAVLEHGEVALLEPRDVRVAGIGDRHAQLHHVDTRAERERPGGCLAHGRRGRDGEPEQRRDAGRHAGPAGAAQGRRSLTVIPGTNPAIAARTHDPLLLCSSPVLEPPLGRFAGPILRLGRQLDPS